MIFATVLLVTVLFAPAVPLLQIIPLKADAPVAVAEVETPLMLFNKVVLPTVLLFIIMFAPPEAAIPLKPAKRVLLLLIKSTPETILFEKLRFPPAPDLKAIKLPLATVVVKVKAPFVVVDPNKLLKIFTFPLAILIP